MDNVRAKRLRSHGQRRGGKEKEKDKTKMTAGNEGVLHKKFGKREKGREQGICRSRDNPKSQSSDTEKKKMGRPKAKRRPSLREGREKKGNWAVRGRQRGFVTGNRIHRYHDSVLASKRRRSGSGMQAEGKTGSASQHSKRARRRGIGDQDVILLAQKRGGKERKYEEGERKLKKRRTPGQKKKSAIRSEGDTAPLGGKVTI